MESAGANAGVASASVEAALDAMEARGARSYDAPACDCVRALLSRADELGGGVAQRLCERAASHLDSLRTRFERDQQRITAALERSEATLGEQPTLRKQLSRGEMLPVARRLRRLSAFPLALRRESGIEPQRLTPGLRNADSTLSERRRRSLSYEDSVAQLVAALALARATDVVPADAGPYNPLRIASELLDRMRDVSPFYLAVQLNRLEELGSLLSLPELPAKPVEKPRALRRPEPSKSGAKRPGKR